MNLKGMAAAAKKSIEVSDKLCDTLLKALNDSKMQIGRLMLALDETHRKIQSLEYDLKNTRDHGKYLSEEKQSLEALEE